MTKQEALEAISNGCKVTHNLFTPEEYIAKSDDNLHYLDEDNYKLSIKNFWDNRTRDYWNEGWSIKE